MKDEKDEIHEVELVISKALRIGVILSGTIIFIGLIMYLGTGKTGYPESYYPVDFLEIFKGFAQLKPYGIIMTGLVLLIATPIFRVGISVILFLYEKDYLYVKITIFVFLTLVLSIFMGKVG